MTTSLSKFKNKKQSRAVLESAREPESTKSERSRLVKVLNTGYKAADLEDTVNKVGDLNKEKNVSP